MTWDRSTVIPAILERIANGESLRTICRDDGMPNRETVRVWLDEDETESGQYTRAYVRAHEDQGDYWVDQVKQVVAEKPPFVADTNHKAGEGRMDSAFVAWQRLRADKYQWIASQLHPKRYGKAQIDLTHAAPDGGPLVVSIERTIVRSS